MLLTDITPSTLIRFWSKVNKEGPIPEHKAELGPCWIWTGAPNNKGYGKLRLQGKRSEEYAHRVSWAISMDASPDGICVCHHCDNPLCVRPSHLFSGTRVDNASDMAAKGRGNTTKLTPEQIEYIRAVYGSRPYGIIGELAETFNVHRSSIRRAAKKISFRLL